MIGSLEGAGSQKNGKCLVKKKKKRNVKQLLEFYFLKKQEINYSTKCKTIEIVLLYCKCLIGQERLRVTIFGFEPSFVGFIAM